MDDVAGKPVAPVTSTISEAGQPKSKLPQALEMPDEDGLDTWATQSTGRVDMV